MSDHKGASILLPNLPQAKVYRQSCAIGPCVLLASAAPPRSQLVILLTIERNGETVFEDQTTGGEMVREFDELIGWLMRENEFPAGAALLTGTGIVPPDEFTLENGDVVHVEIPGIGVLTNPVVKASRK